MQRLVEVGDAKLPPTQLELEFQQPPEDDLDDPEGSTMANLQIPDLRIPVIADVRTPLQCDNTNPCVRSKFNATTGRCEDTAIIGPCDDGNACTVGDVCDRGTCSGTVRSCDDDNPCTLNLCNADDGCSLLATTLNEARRLKPGEIYGERPDLFTLLGAALIITSGLYTLNRERQRRRDSRVPQ